MSNQFASRIHPTAVISPEAELADDVTVGPYCVIEGKVTIGPGCVLRPHALLCGPLTMGRGNVVFSGAVLGEKPQHLKYRDEPTAVEIGDHNIFREQVTVHRGTTHSGVTRIGNANFLMANSHVAHDCVVANNCILANGALIAGCCTLGDGAIVSGNSGVHQFCRLGRLALLSGCSVSTKDIPPFVIQQGINCVVGVNVVGMRRAGVGADQINAVRQAFRVLYLEKNILPVALGKVEAQFGHHSAVAEMLSFIRSSERGINFGRDHDRQGRRSAA